jgi:hypothetical protein
MVVKHNYFCKQALSEKKFVIGEIVRLIKTVIDIFLNFSKEKDTQISIT